MEAIFVFFNSNTICKLLLTGCVWMMCRAAETPRTVSLHGSQNVPLQLVSSSNSRGGGSVSGSVIRGTHFSRSGSARSIRGVGRSGSAVLVAHTRPNPDELHLDMDKLTTTPSNELLDLTARHRYALGSTFSPEIREALTEKFGEDISQLAAELHSSSSDQALDEQDGPSPVTQDITLTILTQLAARYQVAAEESHQHLLDEEIRRKCQVYHTIAGYGIAFFSFIVGIVLGIIPLAQRC